MISWFCLWHRREGCLEISDADRRGIFMLIRNCAGLANASVMTPSENVDPHYEYQAGSPELVLQLDFCSLADLEAALGAGGPLAPLADSNLFASLKGYAVVQEAMLRRTYATGTAARDAHIAYLVTYEGPAENERAWHAHYLDCHRALLGKLPGLLALEIFTPAVVVSRLPFVMQKSLQRNKTAFASLDTMRAAMQSGVRDELRRDFSALPPFSGAGTHYPFLAMPAALQGEEP